MGWKKEWKDWTPVHRDEQGNQYYYRRKTGAFGTEGASEWQLVVIPFNEADTITEANYGDYLVHHADFSGTEENPTATAAQEAAVEMAQTPSKGNKYEDRNIESVITPTADPQAGTTVGDRMASGEYGTPQLTKGEWFGMNEDAQAQYIIDTKYGGDTSGADGILGTKDDTDLAYIKSKLKLQPELGEVDQTRLGFLGTTYGGGDTTFADSLTGREASSTLGQSLTSIQDATSNVDLTGTTGGSLRGQVGLGTKVGKAVGSTYDAYGLTKDKADLAYDEGVYGLEQARDAAWEESLTGFFNILPSATGD